jgi:hypothetical protein
VMFFKRVLQRISEIGAQFRHNVKFYLTTRPCQAKLYCPVKLDTVSRII